MTREEAAEFTRKLLARAETIVFPKTPKTINHIPVFYFEAVIAALRGPVPDPDTGLVPCGCGGKAQLGKLQYTISDPDLMPEYYAYCQDCGITTENSADRERVEAAWNRAMGRASE